MIRSLPFSPPPSCSDQPTSEGGHIPRQNVRKTKNEERRTALFTTETSSKCCAHVVSLLDGWVGVWFYQTAALRAILGSGNRASAGDNIPTATACCAKIGRAARAQSLLDVKIKTRMGVSFLMAANRGHRISRHKDGEIDLEANHHLLYQQ
jgi:hypothetical protein